MRAMVAEMLSKVEYLASHHVNNSSVEKSKSLEEVVGIAFPILNEEDFNVFEAKLQNASIFSRVSIELANIGGNSNFEFIKRAVGSILSDEILVNYSWYGRKGNKVFKTLSVAKLLIGEYFIVGTILI
nr:unnamed protein product [Callosobruchus analis]